MKRHILFFMWMGALLIGCGSDQSWLQELPPKVKDYIVAVGKAKYTIEPSEVELTASQRARDALEKELALWLKKAKKIWIQKSKLYQPFDDPDFVNVFLPQMRAAAEILLYHADKPNQELICLVGLPLENFLGQLRTQAAHFIARHHRIAKEDEVLWNSTMKEVVAILANNHNKKARWQWDREKENFSPWEWEESE